MRCGLTSHANTITHSSRPHLASCGGLSTLRLQHNCALEKSRDSNRCSHFLLQSSVWWLSLRLPPTSRPPSVSVRHETVNSKVLMATVQLGPAVVDWDGWADIVKGVDDAWLYVSEGTGGPGPEIAYFNLSLWTWPLSQLYSSCSNTHQVSSFLLHTHCFSQIWFLVVGRLQAR